MESNTMHPISSLKSYFTRMLIGLFSILTICQGIFFGGDPALAVSAIDVRVPEGIGNSKASVVKQLEAKEKTEAARIQTAMKDGDRSTRSSLDKAKNAMEYSADKAEKPINDTPKKVKKTADRNSKQAEKFSKATTKKAKNFFGF
jgi:hypothetical protein